VNIPRHHSTRAYTRAQARGAAPELRRVADTTPHTAYPQARAQRVAGSVVQWCRSCRVFVGRGRGTFFLFFFSYSYPSRVWGVDGL